MAAVLLFYFHAAFVLHVGFLAIGVNSDSSGCPSVCACLGGIVDCSKKGLTEVPKDLPTWTTQLLLESNNLNSLSVEPFRGLMSLDELDLGNNKITRLNSTLFEYLPSLRKLKLPYNRLQYIPFIPKAGNLTHLILHHNLINFVDGVPLKQMTKLRYLDLSFNNISELKNGIFPAKSKIHRLFLNSNRISRIEIGAFVHLKVLRRLKLNNNRLTLLLKVFGNMSNLHTLELNNNRLTKIDGLNFHGMEHLQVLLLRHNVIKELHDGAFWKLKELHTLDLESNNISTVEKGWLYGLDNLKKLFLSHNRINLIHPDGWDFCEKLTDLYMSHNQLDAINSATFHKLRQLERLYIDYNKVLRIEDGAFHGLDALQRLELNNNMISWTVDYKYGAFTGLQRLTRLGLDSNRISSITTVAFSGLTTLKQLYLVNNNITSIQRDAFSDLESLKELNFNASTLLCDCKLAWLPEWLIESGFKYSVNATCAHPDKLKGKSIFDIPASEFKCDDQPRPVIVKHPRTQAVLRGSNLTLECTAESSTNYPMFFSWKKNNKLIHDPNIENYMISKGNGSVQNYTSLLHLMHITKDDEGLYQCIVRNKYDITYSQKAKITTHVFPVFTKTPKDVIVKASDTARLECAANGEPRPVIAWQKDGGEDFPAARERRMHVMPTDDVFFIVGVKASDAGIYSCTVTSPAGTIIANASLTVLETPAFKKHMKDRTSRVGDTTVMECMATGSPKPQLSWLKDGKPLEVINRHFFIADHQLLVIVHTTFSDAGKYTCEMTNSEGMKSDSAMLTVVGRDMTPQTGYATANGLTHQSTTIGIIIIAVVCCVVGTSLVWVIIIYQTRRRHEEYSSTPTDELTLPVDVPSSTYQSSERDDGRSSPVSLPLNGHSTLISFSGRDLRESHSTEPVYCNGHIPVQYHSDGEDTGSRGPLLGIDNKASSIASSSPPRPHHISIGDMPTMQTFQKTSSPITTALVHTTTTPSISQSPIISCHSTLGGQHGTQPPQPDLEEKSDVPQTLPQDHNHHHHHHSHIVELPQSSIDHPTLPNYDSIPAHVTCPSSSSSSEPSSVHKTNSPNYSSSVDNHQSESHPAEPSVIPETLTDSCPNVNNNWTSPV